MDIQRVTTFSGDYPFSIVAAPEKHKLMIKSLAAYDFITSACEPTHLPLILQHQKYTFKVKLEYSSSTELSEEMVTRFLDNNLLPKLENHSEEYSGKITDITLTPTHCKTFKNRQKFISIVNFQLSSNNYPALYNVNLLGRTITIKTYQEKSTLINNIQWVSDGNLSLEKVYNKSAPRKKKLSMEINEEVRPQHFPIVSTPFLGNFPFSIQGTVNNKIVKIEIIKMKAFDFKHKNHPPICLPLTLRHSKYKFSVEIEGTCSTAINNNSITELLQRLASPKLRPCTGSSKVGFESSKTLKTDQTIVTTFHMFVHPDREQDAIYDLYLFNRIITVKILNDLKTFKKILNEINDGKITLEKVGKRGNELDVNKPEKRKEVETTTRDSSQTTASMTNPESHSSALAYPITSSSQPPQWVKKGRLTDVDEKSRPHTKKSSQENPTQPKNSQKRKRVETTNLPSFKKATSISHPTASSNISSQMFSQNMHFLPSLPMPPHPLIPNQTYFLYPQISYVPVQGPVQYFLPPITNHSLTLAPLQSNPILDVSVAPFLPPLPAIIPSQRSNLTLDKFKIT